MSISVPDNIFLCPTDLSVTPTGISRVAVIGQCLLAGWKHLFSSISPGGQCDFVIFNNAQKLAPPPVPIEQYDFQIVGLPLRSTLPDSEYFRLRYEDADAYARLFDETVDRIRQFLSAAMDWNRESGLLSFVVNFPVPQQNPMGRLLPRY